MAQLPRPGGGRGQVQELCPEEEALVVSGHRVALLSDGQANRCRRAPAIAGTPEAILEGYRARSAGEVRVLGHDPEHGERALRERVGIVLQEAAAQAELTVAEVLTMYGRYYPRRRAAGELVELVGLAGKEGERVKLLSGGQRRRLDLALLEHDPTKRILDQPGRRRGRRSRRRDAPASDCT